MASGKTKANKPTGASDRMIAEQPTITRAKPDERTSPPAHAPIAKEEKSKESEFLAALPALVLAFCATLSGWMAVQYLFHSESKSRHSTELSSTGQPLDRAEMKRLEERVGFYRHSTGWKLNRDRINTQLENRSASSVVEGADVPLPKPGMMNGLPLAGEKLMRSGSRDLKLATPDFADSRTIRAVEAEKAAAEAEREEQNQYVKEFVQNAKREGYDVVVDAAGNVHFKGDRNPSDVGGFPDSLH
jgi:hypothetical protein